MPDDAGHMMSGDAGLVFRLRFPRLPDDAAGRGSDLSGTGDVGPVIPGPGQEADGSEKEDKEDRECMIHGNMIRGNLHSFFFFLRVLRKNSRIRRFSYSCILSGSVPY